MDFDRLEDLEETDLAWSVSRLQTIMRCGARYRYKYILKTPEAATPPLAFGTAIHKCIETLHLTNRWDDESLQRLWSDEWYQAQIEVDWNATSYRKSTYDNKGTKILETYAAKHQDDKWYGLECDFEQSMGEGLPFFRGKFDKIQLLTEHPSVPQKFVGRLAVVDFKTSKNPPDETLLSVDLQLIIYHRAFYQLTGHSVVVGLHHLPTDTIYWKEPTQDDFGNVVIDMLKRGIKRINSEEFERNIDWSCKFCPFKKQCLGDLSDASVEVCRDVS